MYLILSQPLHLVKVTKGRLPSADVCKKTVHRRCSELETIRGLVSSGSSSGQLMEEVRALTTAQRQQLLTDGGFTIEIAAQKGLAMKADLAIPWNKLRVIRR